MVLKHFLYCVRKAPFRPGSPFSGRFTASVGLFAVPILEIRVLLARLLFPCPLPPPSRPPSAHRPQHTPNRLSLHHLFTPPLLLHVRAIFLPPSCVPPPTPLTTVSRHYPPPGLPPSFFSVAGPTLSPCVSWTKHSTPPPLAPSLAGRAYFPTLCCPPPRLTLLADSSCFLTGPASHPGTTTTSMLRPGSCHTAG